MYRKLIFLISLLSLVSCDIKEKGVDIQEKIFIESEFGNQVITHYDIPLKITDISGNDITAQSDIYLDGNPYTGNILNFSLPGTHQVSAKISLDGETKSSDPLTLTVINPQSSTKVLVEDITGTWCVNCPRVAYHLEEAVQQNNKVIPTAIHFSRFQGDDPFGYDNISYFVNTFNISGLPTAIVNRDINWNEQYAGLENYLNKSQPMGLAINSTVNGNNLNIEVKVRFDMDFTNKDLNLVVYLNENQLIHDQENATSFYGGQNPIVDFEHNHVLRYCFTGESGEAISNNKKANEVYTYQFNGTIPGNVSDINNCEIVAFVVDNGTPAKVINIQKATINTQQNFD